MINTQKGTRNNRVFHSAYRMALGGASEEEILPVARSLARDCLPPLEEKEVERTVRSAVERARCKAETRKIARNIAQETREFVESSVGPFSLADVYRDLSLIESNDKKAAKEALRRLVGKDIERIKQRYGLYRRIEADYEVIDLTTADDTPLEINWPLEIEKFFKCLPKSIIVVAGEPDAGKTAFLLDFARHNMFVHEIYYFSSEMGPPEFKSRLSLSTTPLQDWNRIHFGERSENFADVIQPDAINIIDFLEIYENFFQVGKHLKEIFDRLNRGIAVVAIQKDKMKDVGRGGGFGLEKPRLYLTLTHDHVINIVKCKTRADSRKNSNRSWRKFQIVGGCLFIPDGDWQKESDDNRYGQEKLRSLSARG